MQDGDSIEWERGWVAPEGALPLVHDAWLQEADWLQWANSDVVTLAAVRETSCLLLLGEPGSGKSVCLTREAAIADQSGQVIHYVDLGLAQDARDLRERVFDHPTVAGWREDGSRLHLFLDSLDEAKVQIRRVVSLLEEGLSECDVSRLVLRMTCRTADRPVELETWLEERFGAVRFKTLELAPLRMSEAGSVAAAAGVDGDLFIESAIGAGAAPFAARPLTLKMLLRLFVAQQGFPDTLASLYWQGLLLMAGESDDERRSLRALSDTQAFAVAARIAAATMLSGRDVIGDGGVEFRELSGGDEIDRLVAAPTAVAVDEAAVREVVGTALFTARSQGVGWAHRTFGEYLAAFWLAGERITEAQLGDLLLVDDGAGLRVAPSLRNIGGWLLASRPNFQDQLSAPDALVLAYGDPSSVPTAVRRSLLPALLDAVDDQEIDRAALRTMWHRIAYEDIENDLTEYLANTSREPQTRQAAMDAVAELQLNSLVPLLVHIALSPGETIRLRTAALYALRAFDVAVPLAQIRPLAIEPQPGDRDDELKGAALWLCWPTAITAQELFGALTVEKNEALLGAYASFLHNKCLEHLTSADDLLRGIRWGLTLPRHSHSTRDVNIVADVIVTRAWPLAATVPAIAEALADLVALGAPNFTPVLTTPRSLRKEAPESGLDDEAANEAILGALVERIARGEFTGELLSRALLRGFGKTLDLGRVIERWATAPSSRLKTGWRAAIDAIARGANAEALFDVKDTYPELYAQVAWRYEAIVIDSPEAEAMRQQHRNEEDALGLPQESAVDPADFDRQVVAELEAFRDGDVDAFWRLLEPLSADDQGRVQDFGHRDDLTRAPGWLRLAEEHRHALVDAAGRFLERASPEPERWVGKPVFFYPAHAGYCALKLLFNTRRAEFDELKVVVWRRWAPVVVTKRRYEQVEDQEEFRQVAMRHVRLHAADIARETVVLSFGNRLSAAELATARDRLGEMWDATLDDVLFAQLDRSDLELHQVVAIIETLLANDHAGAEAWAAARVSAAALLGDETLRGLALGMVGALAAHAPNGLWSLIDSIAAEDEPATKVLLTRLIHHSESSLEQALLPAEVGRLFALLHDLFPRDLNAPQERAFEVTVEMEASIRRGRIVERLAGEATPEAIAVIAELEERFDENGWIRRMRHRALEQARRQAWYPPAPAAIVRMGSADARRHVADTRGLRRLVRGELMSIGAQMRGSSPLAPTLWNTKPHRLPKDENEISNQLVLWLRGRLGEQRAIVNREVGVNLLTGASGDRTDILVQATTDTGDPLSTVIEVKGAWNRELMTAMDDQLATKYLKPDLTDQGIYLVFWFAADGWEDYGDETQRRRRARATRLDANALASLLEVQAADVSQNRGVTVTALVIDASMGMR